MLNSTFYNEMLFTKLAQPAKAEAATSKKPAAPKKPDSDLFSFLPPGAQALARQGQQALAKAQEDPNKFKAETAKSFVKNLSASRDRESVPSRIGLTSKRFTIPQFLASSTPASVLSDEGAANALLRTDKMPYFGTDPKDGSALTYFTPQNVNRAAMLGGTVAGGVSGGNTLKSWGAGLGGSLGGSLIGGYASEGINRAIDAAYGIPQGSDRGYVRRVISDVLLPSAGAIAGGYYAGRATR